MDNLVTAAGNKCKKQINTIKQYSFLMKSKQTYTHFVINYLLINEWLDFK